MFLRYSILNVSVDATVGYHSTLVMYVLDRDYAKKAFSQHGNDIFTSHDFLGRSQKSVWLTHFNWGLNCIICGHMISRNNDIKILFLTCTCF